MSRLGKKGKESDFEVKPSKKADQVKSVIEVAEIENETLDTEKTKEVQQAQGVTSSSTPEKNFPLERLDEQSSEAVELLNLLNQRLAKASSTFLNAVRTLFRLDPFSQFESWGLKNEKEAKQYQEIVISCFTRCLLEDTGFFDRWARRGHLPVLKADLSAAIEEFIQLKDKSLELAKGEFERAKGKFEKLVEGLIEKIKRDSPGKFFEIYRYLIFVVPSVNVNEPLGKFIRAIGNDPVSRLILGGWGKDMILEQVKNQGVKVPFPETEEAKNRIELGKRLFWSLIADTHGKGTKTSKETVIKNTYLLVGELLGDGIWPLGLRKKRVQKNISDPSQDVLADHYRLAASCAFGMLVQEIILLSKDR